MPRVMTQNLVPGMILEEDVYTQSRQLIFLKNQELTDNYIARLVFYSIESVNVKPIEKKSEFPDEETLRAEVERIRKEILSQNSSYSKKIVESREFHVFKECYNKSVRFIEGYLNDVVEKHIPLNKSVIVQEVNDLLAKSAAKFHIFDMLHNMRHYDDPTYAHCVNVALICNVFGKWMGFEEYELEILTLAGLLHDIGKIKIPEKIITKPGKLTPEEFEIIKTHTTEGYKILKDSGLDQHVVMAALMHHERMDGSGYPHGLKDNEIDPCARIVAIADVYDAMTSARVYRGPLCPFTVVGNFEAEGYRKYDSQYIFIFLEYIVNTYLYNRVRLSDGRIGDIVMINKNDLSHPVVCIENEYFDLSKLHGLSVEAIM